jgi:uncharacterized cupin superfamily protein
MADIGRAVGSQTIGLTVQTVAPGCRASRRHQHVFREEILTVMVGAGTLLQGDARLPVGPGDCFCCTPQGEELHTFENTGTDDQVIWAFGNRFRHEVCLYPDEGVAFVEGLGAEIPLATAVDSPGRRSDGSGERIPSTIGVPPPVCAPSRYDGGYELGKPHHWPAIGEKNPPAPRSGARATAIGIGIGAAAGKKREPGARPPTTASTRGLARLIAAVPGSAPVVQLSLYCLYPPSCPSAAGISSHARAAAVAVAIIRCGEW